MANRFTLYYWPIPFRAQGIRYLLAYAGAVWDEAERDVVTDLYQSAVADQPLPFMGPPLLHDRQEHLWFSQAPAIASYLGETLGLMPGTPPQDAVTRKVLGDCSDVLQEMTRDCGALMWTDEAWGEFAEGRLPRWLEIFEVLGARHGLKTEAGTLLGTEEAGVADFATAALWVTICDTLPGLEETIASYAPNVLSLSQRIANTPAIQTLRADQKARWGVVWCEGEIEVSLRTALANWRR